MLKTGVVPESTPEKHQFKIPAFEKTSSTCRRNLYFIDKTQTITLLMFKKQDMSSFQEEFCSV